MELLVIEVYHLSMHIHRTQEKGVHTIMRSRDQDECVVWCGLGWFLAQNNPEIVIGRLRVASWRGRGLCKICPKKSCFWAINIQNDKKERIAASLYRAPYCILLIFRAYRPALWAQATTCYVCSERYARTAGMPYRLWCTPAWPVCYTNILSYRSGSGTPHKYSIISVRVRYTQNAS